MSNCARGDGTPSPAPFLIRPTQTPVNFPHQQQFFRVTSDRSPLKGQQNKRKKAMDSEIEEHSPKRQRILPSVQQLTVNVDESISSSSPSPSLPLKL